ncbi:MAG: glycosyltransferase [Rhizobacter sp.]|nr:glycosyltransferase [Ferruginibacter sp.]
MRDFAPYQIFRWDLSEANLLPALNTNCYITCWWKQLPLAHVWQQAGSSSTNNDLLKKINDAIQPTLQYYGQQSKENYKVNIADSLAEKNYAALNTWLHKSAGMILPAAVSQHVSVVICTKNRPRALQNCLEHLQRCDGDFEIIVVDNFPSDAATKMVVASFSKVIYVAESRPGLDIARNTGAHYASGDIIAYTDDDVSVPANWVENMSNCFNDPLTMAVTGLVIPVQLQTPAPYIFEKDWSFNKGYVPASFDHAYFLHNKKWGVPAWEIGAGANMAFRKQAFQLAGFFDERLDAGAAGCSGDSEMWFRILAEGWNCQYYPHVYVYHDHRSSMQELKNQLYNYMRGHVAALLVQNEKYPGTGNLRRFYKGLPFYYLTKIARQLFKSALKIDPLLTAQIKGCIAGWKYYKENKNNHRRAIYTFPEELMTIEDDPRALVSVVIPCYNHAKYLGAAIESVGNQTYPYKEIIVVDDGSTENIFSICEKYPVLVKYVRVERVGLSAARNIGVQYSKGAYLVFLDADDLLYPEALEINRYFLNYYKEAMMVSGGHNRINEKGEYLSSPVSKITEGNNYSALLQGNYIAMEGTAMYRRELFFHFSFNTGIKSCEDYQLNLQVARYFPVFGHDKIVAAYRIHRHNMSNNKSHMIQYALKVLRAEEKKLVSEEERIAWRQGMENWKSYYK